MHEVPHPALADYTDDRHSFRPYLVHLYSCSGREKNQGQGTYAVRYSVGPFEDRHRFLSGN